MLAMFVPVGRGVTGLYMNGFRMQMRMPPTGKGAKIKHMQQAHGIHAGRKRKQECQQDVGGLDHPDNNNAGLGYGFKTFSTNVRVRVARAFLGVLAANR